MTNAATGAAGKRAEITASVIMETTETQGKSKKIKSDFQKVKAETTAGVKADSFVTALI